MIYHVNNNKRNNNNENKKTEGRQLGDKPTLIKQGRNIWEQGTNRTKWKGNNNIGIKLTQNNKQVWNK